VLARIVASHLTLAGGKPIVDNRPGASGQIAADFVRKSPADGQTMFIAPSSVMCLVPHVYRKPLFDGLRDFRAIGGLCDHTHGLAVRADSPITSVRDFVSWAKAKPNAATYASPGAGTSPHLLGATLVKVSGAPLTHIPYRGVAPGIQDLIGGQVASMFCPVPTLLEYQRAGRIRVLALSSPQRIDALPTVPTFKEAGFPDLEYVEWFGLFAPIATPPNVLAPIDAALRELTASTDYAAAARRIEVIPRSLSAAQMQELLAVDYPKGANLVKKSGVELDA
jgi:tripartite-type tricarboxylate transporter receptor subunit TctC